MPSAIKAPPTKKRRLSKQNDPTPGPPSHKNQLERKAMREYWVKTFGKEPPWLRLSDREDDVDGDEEEKTGKKRRETGRPVRGGKEPDDLADATKVNDSTAEATEISTAVQQENATPKDADTNNAFAQDSTANPSVIPAVAALDSSLAPYLNKIKERRGIKNGHDKTIDANGSTAEKFQDSSVSATAANAEAEESTGSTAEKSRKFFHDSSVKATEANAEAEKSTTNPSVIPAVAALDSSLAPYMKMVSLRKQAVGGKVSFKDSFTTEALKQKINVGPKVTYTTHIPDGDRSNRYFTIDVPPGSLGLTLIIVDQKGASVVAIDKHCPLKRLLRVGDIILTINGLYVRHMQQFGVGKDKTRRFVVLRPSVAPHRDPLGAAKPAASNTALKAAATNDKFVNAPNAAATNASNAAQETATYNAANIAQPIAAEAMQEGEKTTITTLDTILPPSAADRIQFHQSTSRNIFGTTEQHTAARQELLSEIMCFNKKNDLDSIAKRGKSLYQIVAVPMTNKKEVSWRRFYDACKRTGALDDFMNGWAKFCGDSEELAASMVIKHLIEKYPKIAATEFESIKHWLQQVVANDSNKLPEGFVSYDGSNDLVWNEQFGELCKYKGLHGDLPPVRNGGKLGRWMSYQRRSYGDGKLSAARIAALENIGFKWMGGNITKRQIHGGDPKHCRAVAAKMIFPQLNYRECLYLGGWTEEELDDGVDQKHTWRNHYVRQKDKISTAIKNYDSRSSNRKSSKRQIEELVGILKSEDNDRFERVFGEHSSLLPQFLEAARERENEETVKPRRKRAVKELSESSDHEDSEQDLSDNEQLVDMG